MANVLIVATGTVYTGSSDGDSIQFQSAALQGSTILGEGGADTINLNQNVVSTTELGFIAKGGDGNDSIFVDRMVFKTSAAPTVMAGAGNDTITISGGTLGLVQAQDGNDVVTMNGGSLDSFFGGKNADDLVFSGTISSSLGMGRGHDKISASTITFGSGISASLKLGEGRDTIEATINDNGSALTFLGDAGNGTNAAADSIDLEIGASNGTGFAFNAGGGADTIAISGGAIESANLAFGKGADSVNLSSVLASDLTIGLGEGADTITLAQDAVLTGNLNGGLGNDLITLSGSGDGSLTTINGGAGADSVTISVSGINEATQTIAISALSESTLTDTDVVTFNGVAGDVFTGTFDFNNSSKVVAQGAATAASIFGNADNKATMLAGVVTFSGTLSASSVSSTTAAMAAVDTLTLGGATGGVGTVAFFTANSTNYLFMQGGTAGTADDSLIQLGGVSGAILDAGNGTAVTVDFSI